MADDQEIPAELLAEERPYSLRKRTKSSYRKDNEFHEDDLSSLSSLSESEPSEHNGQSEGDDDDGSTDEDEYEEESKKKGKKNVARKGARRNTMMGPPSTTTPLSQLHHYQNGFPARTTSLPVGMRHYHQPGHPLPYYQQRPLQPPPLPPTLIIPPPTPLLDRLNQKQSDLIQNARIEATRDESLQGQSQTEVEGSILRLPTRKHRSALCLTMNRYSAFCCSPSVDIPAFPITGYKVAIFLARASDTPVGRSLLATMPQTTTYPLPTVSSSTLSHMNSKAEGEKVTKELVQSWAEALAYAQSATKIVWERVLMGQNNSTSMNPILNELYMLEVLNSFEGMKNVKGAGGPYKVAPGTARVGSPSMVGGEGRGKRASMDDEMVGAKKKTKWVKGGKPVDAPRKSGSTPPGSGQPNYPRRTSSEGGDFHSDSLTNGNGHAHGNGSPSLAHTHANSPHYGASLPSIYDMAGPVAGPSTILNQQQRQFDDYQRQYHPHQQHLQRGAPPVGPFTVQIQKEKAKEEGGKKIKSPEEEFINSPEDDEDEEGKSPEQGTKELEGEKTANDADGKEKKKDAQKGEEGASGGSTTSPQSASTPLAASTSRQGSAAATSPELTHKEKGKAKASGSRASSSPRVSHPPQQYSRIVGGAPGGFHPAAGPIAVSQAQFGSPQAYWYASGPPQGYAVQPSPYPPSAMYGYPTVTQGHWPTGNQAYYQQPHAGFVQSAQYHPASPSASAPPGHEDPHHPPPSPHHPPTSALFASHYTPSPLSNSAYQSHSRDPTLSIDIASLGSAHAMYAWSPTTDHGGSGLSAGGYGGHLWTPTGGLPSATGSEVFKR